MRERHDTEPTTAVDVSMALFMWPGDEFGVGEVSAEEFRRDVHDLKEHLDTAVGLGGFSEPAGR